MGLEFGGVRRLNSKFAFTVHIEGQVKPFDIVCTPKRVL